MRKHSVRKWLHALLDLLPLVVIPVFMVYSHRHQIDTYSVERTEYRTVEMQQNVINGIPTFTFSQQTTIPYWNLYGSTVVESANPLLLRNDSTGIMEGDINVSFENLNENDICIIKVDSAIDDGDYINLNFYYGEELLTGFQVNTVYTNKLIRYESRFTIDLNLTGQDFTFNGTNSGNEEYLYLENIQFFNLTQMFGSGNEPTIDEFNALFPNDYYAVDSNAVAYVPYTRTYNDTDIGSQIFYSLYNSVDKYFNCNKLFSFNGVYNWINFNLFGGNAPLMVDVVYQIIVYEFFMDLIFLIYSVFMFIIDFASNFLEYSFSWSHRGGR